MKKNVIYIALASLMLAGASYFENSNKMLVLDEVEALSKGEPRYAYRRNVEAVDEREGYGISEEVYEERYIHHWVPEQKIPMSCGGTMTIKSYPVYDTRDVHAFCCMPLPQGETGKCDFAKDPLECYRFH